MNVLRKFTLKTLRRNRTRTVVTIIGVILSAAMFTAVTTFISTMQHFLLESVLASEGSWQSQLTGLPYSSLDQVKDNGKVKTVAVQQEVGYAASRIPRTIINPISIFKISTPHPSISSASASSAAGCRRTRTNSSFPSIF